MPPMPPSFGEADFYDPEGIDAWDDLKRRAPPLGPDGQARLDAFLERIHTPLGPGDSILHHFLPQWYLRRFARGDQIARWDLDSGEREVTNVRNVASQKHLYTTIGEDGVETVAVEKILAVADGDAKNAVERLVFGVFFPPIPQDRAAMAIWLGLLHVRDPYTRRQFEALADQTFKMSLSLIHDDADARRFLRGESDVEPTDEDVRELLEAIEDLDHIEISPHQNDFVRQMLDTGLLGATHFLKRKFSICKFPAPGLIISDRPMLLHQYEANRNPLRGVGLINADEIWLPLDRQHLLILHRNDRIGEVLFHASESFRMDDLNQQVVSSAIQHVYYHPDDVDRVVRLRVPERDRPVFMADGIEFIKGKTDGVNEPPKRKAHRRYRRKET